MANIRSTTPTPRNEPVLGYAPGSPERSTLITELKRQAGTRVEIPLVIGEKKILNAKAEHKIVSPHKHAHQLATYTAATAEDVQAAIQSNLAARKEWAALNWEDRAGGQNTLA